MWTLNIEKTKSKDDHERLKQAEDNIRAQKKDIAELKERVEELEKKKNDNNNNH